MKASNYPPNTALAALIALACFCFCTTSCFSSGSSGSNNTSNLDPGTYNSENYDSGYSGGSSNYGSSSSVTKVYANSYDGFLSVRTGPSTSYTAIGKFWNGPEGAIYLDTASNGWVKVNINGTIGWVSGAYISYTPTQPYVQQDQLYVMAVNAYDGFVNIRDQPNARGNIIGSISNTNNLMDPVLYEASNGWLKINHNGIVGWVNPKYVSVFSSNGLAGDGAEPY